jgi:predicted transcriptional regulator
MEALCDLLFEFSSTERMNIIQSLIEERLRLSQVSKNLDMTLTEASRHLKRLSDVHLIKKNVDGAFILTPYGELSFSLLSSLGFVSDNREFFREHDVSGIPYEFISRINELGSGRLDSNVVGVLAYVNTMIQNSNEYIWVMSYARTLPDTLSIVEEKIKSGVNLRRIHPEDITPIPDTLTLPDPRRTLSRIDIRIIMNEEEAMCSFPLFDDKIDYTSFISKDQKFHKWCRDVFLYYWDIAKPAVM